MLRNYIGLATSMHDPALSIVNSKGEVVFAEATERYLQTKRAWGAAPDDCHRIQKLIAEYGEKDAEFVLAFPWKDTSPLVYGIFRKYYLPRKVKPLLPRILYRFMDITSNVHYAVNHYSAGRFAELAITRRYFEDFVARRGVSSLQDYVDHKEFKRRTVVRKRYDHHMAHAAAACYTSPFSEAVCAVIDGSGEQFETTAFFRYKDGKLTPLENVMPSHYASLGWYYAHLCDACGFESLDGEEWKVMGLAAYGKLDPDLYNTLRRCINVRDCQLVQTKEGLDLLDELLVQGLQREGDPIKMADFAFTGQRVYCDIVSELLTNLHKRGISDNLVIAGGCGLNSAYNGMVTEETPFKNLHVYCAPADDGNAVGAALLAYYEDHPESPAPAKVGSPYLGSSVSQKSLSRLQKFGNLKQVPLGGATLTAKVAELLASGKIIGWMQGRAEFGPRALGNRSILADPRSRNVKDRVNATVKFREEFRPFAPAILHEFGDEYFENYQETPYMERALHFKEGVKHKVPGVVHVDGTGRLQTVKREWNERYYDLIKAFYDITGVPVLLNTSFNVMSKPIVHSVEDAVAVFLTSGIDILVIDDQIFQKGSTVDASTNRKAAAQEEYLADIEA